MSYDFLVVNHADHQQKNKISYCKLNAIQQTIIGIIITIIIYYKLLMQYATQF